MATPEQMNSIEEITSFLQSVKGFEVEFISESSFAITQKADRHRIQLDARLLENTIRRTDEMGREFIQVNFIGGAKILLTDELIGFKPLPKEGQTRLNVSRLPRVVTTPDLISVIEAMDETTSRPAVSTHDEELEVLKALFESIVAGAEKVGFNLNVEKTWLAPFLSKQPSSKLSC